MEKYNTYIYVFSFLLLISFLVFLYFYLINKNNKDSIVNDKNNLGAYLKTFEDNKKFIKLSDFLVDNNLTFKNLFKDYKWIINENWNEVNYVSLMIDEFQKVNTLENFINYEKKYWNQIVMFTSLKLWNKDLFLKYYDFYIDFKEIDIMSWKNKKELLNIFSNIYDKYHEEWFYDEMWYKGEDWVYDYFLLSLMSLDYNQKLKICKKWYKDEDDYNSCIRYITYMSSNKENKYCEKFEKLDEKKWCEDSLELIK